MGFAKRIVLFLAVNILVVLTISLILNFLGVRPYLNAHGLDYNSLMVFCLIWGMGGAFISLALSRKMAKWILRVQVIDPNTNDPHMKELVQMIYELARAANLPEMPEVGIYNSPEVNAFATGPSKRRSLVAVSSGLLNRMSKTELEGVLGHEISHIANGDMVTMTLLQGVVNAFVMFLARVLAFIFSGLGQNRQRSSQGSYMSYTLFVFLFEFVFMILGSLIIAAFSRFREFRADRGGAQLAGRDKMISALQALQRTVATHDVAAEKPALAAFKISHPSKHGGLMHLFATHPPLESRIERLQQGI
ncbi:MAG: protease HtpX [Verrucomicrobia bacterium]|nr:protease HtpX [Verrucomicrobiota bacterium]